MVSNKDSNHPGLTYEDSQSLEVVATIINISIFQQVSNEVCDQEKKKKRPRTINMWLDDTVLILVLFSDSPNLLRESEFLILA